MENLLYKLIDWAAIEDIEYSESSDPHDVLGAHQTEAGLLIQAFIPDAESVEVEFIAVKSTYDMEKLNDKGFFAVLIDRKDIPEYKFNIVYKDGNTQSIYDAYRYTGIYTEDDLSRFERGVHYDIYEKMGAHCITIEGVEGVYFSVWAPGAIRVSVVGDFNCWDGRRHQMRRIGDSGIYEIFIPEVQEGFIYKYEIKTRRGEPMLKSDPYANYSQLRPESASIVVNINGYNWTDEDWMDSRDIYQSNGKNYDGNPMNIYEVHLGSWIRKEPQIDDDGKPVPGSEFYNYRDLAPRLAEYVKDMNYTHIELMPVMEHPLDESWGYQVTGYYAPTSRYGNPQDFMYFMNYMHNEGIGVILDWVPAYFPKDLHGLGAFDGTHVYEHADPRQGEHPHWGTYIYNYGRPQVTNFLIANALFWAKCYHADGIRADAVASMLYLDYGKNDGEWVANKYGGHENLEAIEFLKHLNSIMKIRHNDVLMIAEESTSWPKISGDLRDGGLGFDFKWNMGWMNDFLHYMQVDPYFKSHHYGALTFSMLYQYSENFILVLSHDEVVHGKGTLAGKMPGKTQEEKNANLRVAYGYMMTHPGKKLIFMGQEFAPLNEWNEMHELPWGILKYPVHKYMQEYVKQLNLFYVEHEALWKLDCEPEGFEWMTCNSYKENVVAFVRHSEYYQDDILVVCNFTPQSYPSFDIDVPYHGIYTEEFNSDYEGFGGGGMLNTKALTSKARQHNKNQKNDKGTDINTGDRDKDTGLSVKDDEFDKSEAVPEREIISIQLPPLSMVAFSVKKVDSKKGKKDVKNSAKKTAVKIHKKEQSRLEDKGMLQKTSKKRNITIVKSDAGDNI